MASKHLSDMTDDELTAEFNQWDGYIKSATGWGAALGVANDFRRKVEQEQARRRAFAHPNHVGSLTRVAFTPTHQHRKGTYYEVLGVGTLAVSSPGKRSDFAANGRLMLDGDSVVVYRNQDNQLYVRRLEEFNDGRFTPTV